MNDKRKEYLKKWREDNKEHIQNYKKEYAKTHDSSFKKLQDKYKQLQQENQHLKEELEEYKNPIKYFKYANKNVTDENKQLKDNQVRALNKIRDFIDDANCEIRESGYSNDKHGLYWELFRKDLTNIQKLIKGINIDEYVNIPKYREEELLNLENNWNKLREIAKSQSGFKKRADLKGGLWFEVDELLDKMQELEQGSDE